MHEHAIERLWVRPEAGAAVAARDSLRLVAGEGVEGDHTYGRKRHVTLIFAEDWAAATDALGRPVDPAERRANVLLSGGDGLALVGRTVTLGEVRLEIHGETRPCAVMDKAAAGLMEALRPEGRAGVWGRVLAGGVVRPGDTLAIEA